jgi:hypothetical protein
MVATLGHKETDARSLLSARCSKKLLTAAEGFCGQGPGKPDRRDLGRRSASDFELAGDESRGTGSRGEEMPSQGVLRAMANRSGCSERQLSLQKIQKYESRAEACQSTRL